MNIEVWMDLNPETRDAGVHTWILLDGCCISVYDKAGKPVVKVQLGRGMADPVRKSDFFTQVYP